jgi:hypothetical protein
MGKSSFVDRAREAPVEPLRRLNRMKVSRFGHATEDAINCGDEDVVL